MNNFDNFITPEEAYEFDVINGIEDTTVEMYEKRSKLNEPCQVCETEQAWNYHGCGMCFSCTTGESDASEDYELIG
jgi:hypothetical protein